MIALSGESAERTATRLGGPIVWAWPAVGQSTSRDAEESDEFATAHVSPEMSPIRPNHTIIELRDERQNSRDSCEGYQSADVRRGENYL